jgi:hypothetical protein
MKVTTLELAKSAIENSNGRIFSVKFLKKDGTVRDMTCRLGVKKHVKGVGLNYCPQEHDLITVFDMGKKDYRSVPLDSSLLLVKINGQTLWVV